MNLDSKTPVPALNRLDSPPVPIDDEQRKLILLFGSFVKQARREDRYDDFLHHTFSRWWSKWPVDYPPTPGVIERSKLNITRLLEWAMNVTAQIEPRMHWEALFSGSRGTYIGYTTLINRAANKLPDVPAAVPQHIGPSLPTPSITSDDDDDDDNNNDNNTRDGSSSLDNSEDARSEDSFHEMEISGDGSSAACPIDITVQPESDDM